MLKSLSLRTKVREQNMGEMMSRLGIEPSTDIVYNNGRTFYRAMRTCRACRHAKDCMAWLEVNARPIDAAPHFCPNASEFQSMRVATLPGKINVSANEGMRYYLSGG